MLKKNKKSAILQADLNKQTKSMIFRNQETFLGMKQSNLWKIMKKRFPAFKQMHFLDTCKFKHENMIIPSSTAGLRRGCGRVRGALFPAPTFRDGQKKEWYTCFTLDHQFVFFKKTFFFNRWGCSFNCSNNIHFHVFTLHPFQALTKTTTPATVGMATKIVLVYSQTLFCFSFCFFPKHGRAR